MEAKTEASVQNLTSDGVFSEKTESGPSEATAKWKPFSDIRSGHSSVNQRSLKMETKSQFMKKIGNGQW